MPPGIFTIAGTENDPGLQTVRIVAEPAIDVEEDMAIQVTGTVMTSDPDNLGEIEGVLGDEFDEGWFEDFEESEESEESAAFILATAISDDVGEPLGENQDK